jgi:hypothetical protein
MMFVKNSLRMFTLIAVALGLGACGGGGGGDDDETVPPGS